MRFLYFLVLYNVHCCAWKLASEVSPNLEPDTFNNNKDFNYKQTSTTETGRVFVTLFGYPPKCEKSGVYYACTLSVACWWVGGLSEPGCGTNPWIVACCIKPNKRNEILQPKYEINDEQNYKDLNNQEKSIAQLQKRNDDEEEKCGISSNQILQKRIIGGNEAKFAQFPWQAHIKILSYQCGGVLVSPRYVATAAHCVIKATLHDIIVYLGELDTQNTGKVLEYAPSERHTIENIVIHPHFKYKITQPDRYDIALLELTSKVNQAFHILPICLPEVGMNFKGLNAVIAGWGKIKPSTDLTGTNVLQSTTVPIIDIKKCMSWHKIKHITVELHEEMLCAGHKDGHKDACLGDSGGPLIVYLYGHWTLAGIISAGFGCGEPNQPGIYHSVATTADWMRSIINL